MAGVSLIGTYQHTVDAKGRMAFPTKLRDRLGLLFYVTIGIKDCIYVYSESEWEKFTEKIITLTGEDRDMADFLFSNATDVVPDSQGRVLLPQNLRNEAGINREVIIRGVGNHAEVWDTERYGKYAQSFTKEKLSKSMANMAL